MSKLSKRSFLKTTGAFVAGAAASAVGVAKASPAMAAPLSGIPTNYNGRVAIFYTPHQDDEAIAMGGAIAEHRQAGARVVVVLLSNGRPSTAMGNNIRNLYGPTWTDSAIMSARNAELTASYTALGANDLYLNGSTNQGLIDDVPTGGNGQAPTEAMIAAVMQMVRDFNFLFRVKGPNRLGTDTFPPDHKLISGRREWDSSGYSHELHRASAEAARRLSGRRSGYAQEIDPNQFRLYRCYEYFKPQAQRTGSFQVRDVSAWIGTKRNALNEYAIVYPANPTPPNGRIAYGYKSASIPGVSLIDNAWNDPREFVDLIPALSDTTPK